jgi:hypothetical protein
MLKKFNLIHRKNSISDGRGGQPISRVQFYYYTNDYLCIQLNCLYVQIF